MRNEVIVKTKYKINTKLKSKNTVNQFVHDFDRRATLIKQLENNGAEHQQILHAIFVKHFEKLCQKLKTKS